MLSIGTHIWLRYCKASNATTPLRDRTRAARHALKETKGGINIPDKEETEPPTPSAIHSIEANARKKIGGEEKRDERKQKEQQKGQKEEKKKKKKKKKKKEEKEEKEEKEKEKKKKKKLRHSPQ